MMVVMDGIVHHINDAGVCLYGGGLERHSCCCRRLRNLYLVDLSCDAMEFYHASSCWPLLL